MEPTKNKEKENLEDSNVKPEPDTLNTTDPQDHMEGPVSSLTKKTGENFETDKSKKEADTEKEENM